MILVLWSSAVFSVVEWSMNFSSRLISLFRVTNVKDRNSDGTRQRQKQGSKCWGNGFLYPGIYLSIKDSAF